MRKSTMRMIGLWLIPAAVVLEGWGHPLAAQATGEVFQDCDVCPEMVVVPPGSFMMGSADSEEGRLSWEGSQHRVTIDYRFAVGVHEVTFEEWDACVPGGGCDGHEPDDEGWGRGRRPVINVSWHDAWAYADWLTERTGEEYRLLSEAEWEYVARAGTETARYWGESAQQQCQYANGYDAVAQAELGIDWMDPVGCRDRQANTAPVGSYRPNALGLYDVLGNVREWVDDCWNDSYEGAPTDGSPRYTGTVPFVCCAAAAGSTDWTTSARQCATGTPPGTGAASSGSVWPGPSIDPRILTSLPPSRGSRGQRPLAADSSS